MVGSKAGDLELEVEDPGSRFGFGFRHAPVQLLPEAPNWKLPIECTYFHPTTT